MFEILIYTFLISVSPLGEARAGIPYAILNDANVFWAFLIGLIANMLVYPLLMWLIDTFSQKLWPHRTYRKGVITLSKRAKKIVGASVRKNGFWGLMFFVLIPFPGTGAYMGSIAAYIFKMDRKKSFLAISIGLFFSSIIVAASTYIGHLGFDYLAINFK